MNKFLWIGILIVALAVVGCEDLAVTLSQSPDLELHIKKLDGNPFAGVDVRESNTGSTSTSNTDGVALLMVSTKDRRATVVFEWWMSTPDGTRRESETKSFQLQRGLNLITVRLRDRALYKPTIDGGSLIELFDQNGNVIN